MKVLQEEVVELWNRQDMINDSNYGEDGCCLTCKSEEKGPECWCNICVCRECSAYDMGYLQKCGVAEQFKEEAKRRKEFVLTPQQRREAEDDNY